MLFFLVLFLALSVFLLIRTSNVYVLFLSILILGLLLATFAQLIHMDYTGLRFQLPRALIFSLDYTAVAFIRESFGYDLAWIVRLHNIGVFITMVGSAFIASQSSSRSAVQRILQVVAFLAPVLFLVAADPLFLEQVREIVRQVMRQPGRDLSTVRAFFAGSYVLLATGLLFSPETFAVRSRVARVGVIRRHNLSLAILFLLLHVAVYLLFFVSPLAVYQSNQLIPVPLARAIRFETYPLLLFVFPLVVVLTCLISFSVIVVFGLWSRVDFARDIRMLRHLGPLYESLRDDLHHLKNAFLSIHMIAEGGLNDQSRDSTESLRLIQRTAGESTDFLNRAMKGLKQVDVTLSRRDLAACVREWVDELSQTPEARLATALPDAPVVVLFDSVHLRESLQNLYLNAVDSIREAAEGTGVIEVKLFREFEWIILSVRDNGIGVDPRERRKLTRSFYSSKRRSGNWGVGLSYVTRVARAHFGHIDIEGRPGEYAELSILLPI